MIHILRTFIIISLTLIAITDSTVPVHAIDASRLTSVNNIYNDDTGNTNIILGGGAALFPKDSADGGYSISPVPIIYISRKSSTFTFYTILPYAGVTVSPFPSPIQLTGQFGLGEQFQQTTINENKIRSEAHGLYESEAELKYDAGFWKLGTSVRYSPTKVDASGHNDKYHALLYEAFYERVMPVTMRSVIQAKISIDYMNSGYASTAYSLRDRSGKVVYRAGSGFRKASLFLSLTTDISESISLFSFIEESAFIDEADKSEVTHDRFQTVILFSCLYRINF